jgi:hypothetical protein
MKQPACPKIHQRLPREIAILLASSVAPKNINPSSEILKIHKES